MSFLATIITASIPFYNAYQTYKISSFKIPDSWRKYQFHPSQETIDFANLCGVRGQDVQFFHGTLYGDVARAYGNNSIPESDIAIVMDTALVTFEPSNENDTMRCAANAIIRHEYTHIRNNDTFTRSCLRTIASTAAAVLGVSLLNPLPSLLLTSIASVASHYLYSQFIERRADDAAIKASNKQELLAFHEILKQDQTNNLLMRQSQDLKAKFMISPKGDYRFHPTHPPISSRIAKVEKALSQLD
ncbi:MAG: hypothetical protein FJZ63_01345 [Chlamydiae bacterium]|nr:hypothetical protein [Chlamydiota bacterium]